jgi:hypothetical protein
MFTNEQKIIRAVDNDICDAKMYIRKAKEDLVKLYRNKDGKKCCGHPFDEELYSRIKDNKKEGYLLDFYWKEIRHFDDVNANPTTAMEKSLLCMKKAEELKLEWTKPIKTEFWGGFYMEPYLKCVVTPKMANEYEEYLYHLKLSGSRMKFVTEWLQRSKISMFQLEKEEWIYLISEYYITHNISLEDRIIYRPEFNLGQESRSRLTNHTITRDEISKSIDEIKQCRQAQEKTNPLLNKILKEVDPEKHEKLNYHHYVSLLAVTYDEHPRYFKKDMVVFHPMKPKEDHKKHDLNSYTITMEEVKAMLVHRKNCTSTKEIISKMLTWGKKDINLEEFQWRDLINAYCKEHSIEIKEDTIFYAPRNKERDPKLHLNYFIFDYEELTFDDIGLCLYESDDDSIF